MRAFPCYGMRPSVKTSERRQSAATSAARAEATELGECGLDVTRRALQRGKLCEIAPRDRAEDLRGPAEGALEAGQRGADVRVVHGGAGVPPSTRDVGQGADRRLGTAAQASATVWVLEDGVGEPVEAPPVQAVSEAARAMAAIAVVVRRRRCMGPPGAVLRVARM